MNLNNINSVCPLITQISCDHDSCSRLRCFVQIQSGQVEVLHRLLSSFHFLYANVRHGLLQHLMETYSLFCEDDDMMRNF